MSSEQRKSRRRFLADMLFLGGGLTAAGLLAKSQLIAPEPEPVPAGAMEPTTAVTPRSDATPDVVKTPEKCVELPPEVEGGMKLPSKKVPEVGDRDPFYDSSPTGAVVAPRTPPKYERP